MLYNIYEHIGDDEVIVECEQLVEIQKKIHDIFINLGWQQTIHEEPYTLAIDYTYDQQDVYGNIGLSYEDLPGMNVYSFYLTKWMKVDDKEYFAKDLLAESKPLSFYELEMENLCIQALERYQEWDLDYVIANNLYDIY